jgi:hypothetical protein
VIIEAAKNNITINSVISEKPTLEDVFLKFTGRSMREGEAIGDPISKRRARR